MRISERRWLTYSAGGESVGGVGAVGMVGVLRETQEFSEFLERGLKIEIKNFAKDVSRIGKTLAKFSNNERKKIYFSSKSFSLLLSAECWATQSLKAPGSVTFFKSAL